MRQQYPIFADASARSLEGGTERGLRLGSGIELFHDCDVKSVTCSKTEGQPLRVAVSQFAGTYLSIVANLDQAMLGAIRAAHEVEIRLDTVLSRPQAVFVRLNVEMQHGSGTLYETIVVDCGTRRVRFDLDGLPVRLERCRSAWVDLIFPDPKDSVIEVSDLCLCAGPKGIRS